MKTPQEALDLMMAMGALLAELTTFIEEIEGLLPPEIALEARWLVEKSDALSGTDS